MTTQEIKNKILSTKYFIDNEYLDKYCELIKQNESTEKQENKTNKHHIIPRSYFKMLSLPVDNSAENLVHLLYKDHILVHYYLCLCTKGQFKYKLSVAFFQLVNRKWKYKDFNPEIDLSEYQKIYEEYMVKHSEMAKNLWITTDKREKYLKFLRSKNCTVLEDALERISQDEFYTYYVVEHHSYKDTIKHFNITDYLMGKIIKIFKIEKRYNRKPKSKYENIVKNLNINYIISLYTKEKYSLDEIAEKFNISNFMVRKILVSNNIEINERSKKLKEPEWKKFLSIKEEIYQYYIVENHSYNDTLKHFGICLSSGSAILSSLNIYKSNYNKYKPKIKCVELNIEFKTIAEAVKYLNQLLNIQTISANYISDCCKGKKKQYKGYHWEYIYN